MFVHASALLAILLAEPEADEFAEILEQAEIRLTSPVAMFETVVVLMNRKGVSRAVAEEYVRAILNSGNIAVAGITDEIGRAALDAFERYGKGRGHPAQLNMGDCFAYSAARVHGVSLLYKGNDFAETDLA